MVVHKCLLFSAWFNRGHSKATFSWLSLPMIRDYWKDWGCQATLITTTRSRKIRKLVVLRFKNEILKDWTIKNNLICCGFVPNYIQIIAVLLYIYIHTGLFLARQGSFGDEIVQTESGFVLYFYWICQCWMIF